jgi:CHASE3 domain sensor protein
MKWNVGTKIGAGFGLALAIFVIVGAVSYRAVAQQTEDAYWVSHTHEVQNELTRLLSSLQDAETGQRGYLITGVDRYLAPYTSGAAAAEGNRKRVLQLVSDNPRQVARAEALAPLIAAKLAELQETVEVRRTRDFASAQSIVLTDRGKKAMDDIRQTIQDMTLEEESLLAQRAANTQIAARNARWTIVFGTLAAVVLAGLAGLIITRNIALPLKNLTTVAERITVGDLSVDVPADERTDEVGVLARTFARMTRSLQTMAAVAEKIAAGDLRATLQPQSPNDLLGNAFVRMSSNLRQQIGGMVESASVLGSAAGEIVASTAQLASSSSESAAAVSETTTTV